MKSWKGAGKGPIAANPARRKHVLEVCMKYAHGEKHLLAGVGYHKAAKALGYKPNHLARVLDAGAIRGRFAVRIATGKEEPAWFIRLRGPIPQSFRDLAANPAHRKAYASMQKRVQKPSSITRGLARMR